MTNNIYPCLWFDGMAKSAAEFYCSIFPDAQIKTENAMVVTFELMGRKFMGLNGGPAFTINPSVSFFLYCSTIEEAEHYWKLIARDGNILLPLEDYPWSDKYGWVADQFGVSWQVMYSEEYAAKYPIVPSLLFSGDHYGHAFEAIQYYSSIFSHSAVSESRFYAAEDRQPEGHLALAHFTLHDTSFTALDGGGRHQFAFNEGISLVVDCDTQEEIDRYWQLLTEGGAESKCGWLKDRYGLSWQIVPSILGSLVAHPEHGERVLQELMKMKKIDLNLLKSIAGLP